MTLLESIVAFVILAVVGIACLDLSRGALTLTGDARAWTEAVALGDAAIAAAAAGAQADDESLRAVAVQRRRYADGVDVVDVAVPVAGGRTFRLVRLVAVPRASRVAAGTP